MGGMGLRPNHPWLLGGLDMGGIMPIVKHAQGIELVSGLQATKLFYYLPQA
jgi:hypothetical protein